MYLYNSINNNKVNLTLTSTEKIDEDIVFRFHKFDESELTEVLQIISSNSYSLLSIEYINSNKFDRFFQRLLAVINSPILTFYNCKVNIDSEITPVRVINFGEKVSGKFDVFLFKGLEEITFTSYKTFKGKIYGKNDSLRKLILWYFNPNDKSLKDLGFFKGLRELEINNTNIETLEGIESLTELRSLTINMGIKLREIKNIQNCKKLINVFIHNSKKVEDWHNLEYLPNLEILNLCFDGNLKKLNPSNIIKLKDFRFYKSKLSDGTTITFKNVLSKLKGATYNEQKETDV